MSKKQLQHLQVAIGLLACITLCCFPSGIPFPGTFPGITPFVSSLLALAIAHSLLKLGELPAWMRMGILLPIALAAPLTLRMLPHLLTVLWLLLPFALLLLSIRPRFPTLPPLWYLTSLWISLSLGAIPLLALLKNQINHGLPLLPSHIHIWICILAVIPLGFSTRSMLHPLAKTIARTEIWVALLLIGLTPLLWTAATSFKIPGEPDRNFHSFTPEPRFFLLPKDGIPELAPSELRNLPLKTETLAALDEMTWRLTDTYITSTFHTNGDLSPEEMLRSMKLYGFLLEDRHGAFLPAASFQMSAPDNMDPKYLADFQHSLSRITLSPPEFMQQSGLTLPETQQVFENLKTLNWIRRTPLQEERYRLTAQARKPFENGLYPRQLLFIGQVATDKETEMVQQNYVPRRNLSPFQIFSEFSQLADLQAAETRQAWKWNQHQPFLLSATRWQQTAYLCLAAILALLAGRCLPDQLPHSSLWLLSVLGLICCLQIPFATAFQPALRIGLAVWTARNLCRLTDPECDRLSGFAACGFITQVLMPLPRDSALVHLCAWTLIWTLPAIGLLFYATRPLKPTGPQTSV
ncbi:hypothetical protein P0Y35_07315 [Kiritimatiellaeota bacterium B1221]|nr:hypothetical protein [Kiritimatiellaeota bacterium B1221]